MPMIRSIHHDRACFFDLGNAMEKLQCIFFYLKTEDSAISMNSLCQ